MRAAAYFFAALLTAAPAAAQLPDHPITNATGTATLGAEVTASLSRRDDAAYFNYSDYDNDLLRMARLRLSTELKPHAQLSLLGEVRIATTTGVEVTALFARWRPVARLNFDVQIGLIPPVIGAFNRRAYGRDNPVTGLPLAYQYLTSLRSDALPLTVDDLLRMRARGWRPSYPLGSDAVEPGIALVSASHWDTGIGAHWANDYIDLSAAITRGSPSRPVVKETNRGRQFSGRAAVRFPAGVTVGVSGARGDWLDQSVVDLRPMTGRASLSQTLVGVDASVERGHWILRGEWLHVGFHLPMADAPAFTAPLTSTASFVEARYRFLSRWQIAARAEGMTFSRVQGTLFGGEPTPWDSPVRRIEGTAGVRVLRTLELRAGYQYNWRDAGRVKRLGYPTLQLLYWF